MYAEILLPTDGSQASMAAVTHALDIAATYGARLHALYVVDEGSAVTLSSEPELVSSALETEGRDAVARVSRAGEDAGVEVVTDVVAGRPFESILDYADDHDIDLVVMATHGRRGLDRYLLGSVTERVVRSATAPVLTVRQSHGSTEPDS